MCVQVVPHLCVQVCVQVVEYLGVLRADGMGTEPNARRFIHCSGCQVQFTQDLQQGAAVRTLTQDTLTHTNSILLPTHTPKQNTKVTNAQHRQLQGSACVCVYVLVTVRAAAGGGRGWCREVDKPASGQLETNCHPHTETEHLQDSSAHTQQCMRHRFHSLYHIFVSYFPLRSTFNVCKAQFCQSLQHKVII